MSEDPVKCLWSSVSLQNHSLFSWQNIYCPELCFWKQLLPGTILPSMEAKSFAVWDYVVFAALFVISSGIGVFFAIKERKKATSREFLVGGRQMSFGPVALSLTASFMSAVTVLGAPSEVYRFGASFVLFFISYAFVIVLTSELFLPVFYRSGITSTYEVRQLFSSSSFWKELLFSLHLDIPLPHNSIHCLNNTW